LCQLYEKLWMDRVSVTEAARATTLIKLID